MAENYGHKWSSQNGDEPTTAWIKAMAGFTTADIGRGITALLSRDDQWPPGAIEFRKLCLKPSISPNGVNSQAYKTFKKPAIAKSGKERGNAELARLKQIFN